MVKERQSKGSVFEVQLITRICVRMIGSLRANNIRGKSECREREGEETVDHRTRRIITRLKLSQGVGQCKHSSHAYLLNDSLSFFSKFDCIQIDRYPH